MTCYIKIDNDFTIWIPIQFLSYAEEAEWAIEVMKELNKPIACTMRISSSGDFGGVSPGECAVRMVKAGMYSVSLYQSCE